MKGGRNLPSKHVAVTHRTRQRRVRPASPRRSADEALLDFVLGRTAPDESVDDVGTDDTDTDTDTDDAEAR